MGDAGSDGILRRCAPQDDSVNQDDLVVSCEERKVLRLESRMIARFSIRMTSAQSSSRNRDSALRSE